MDENVKNKLVSLMFMICCNDCINFEEEDYCKECAMYNEDLLFQPNDKFLEEIEMIMYEPVEKVDVAPQVCHEDSIIFPKNTSHWDAKHYVNLHLDEESLCALANIIQMYKEEK